MFSSLQKHGNFTETVEMCQRRVYIDVNKTEHSMVTVLKQRVICGEKNTKLANSN